MSKLPHTPSSPNAYDAGLRNLCDIEATTTPSIIDAMADISPDLAKLEREIVTVAALSALGTADPQLKVHIHGLLNVGGTREQVIELAIQVAAYAGFPAAINAVSAARSVFQERDSQANLNTLHGIRKY